MAYSVFIKAKRIKKRPALQFVGTRRGYEAFATKQEAKYALYRLRKQKGMKGREKRFKRKYSGARIFIGKV